MFTIITSVGNNGEIGKDNSLLWNLPEDLLFLRQTTMNSKVVVGRKTFESIPRKLENREWYIVTGNTNFKVEGAIIINDLDSFIQENKDTDEEIFIIGGRTIYKFFLPYVKKMYITKVKKTFSNANRFFPLFDKSEWNERFLYTNFQNWMFFEHVVLNRN